MDEMNASVSFDSTPAESGREGIGACVIECFERSIEAFQTAGLATEEEIARLRLRAKHHAAEGDPLDFIELLARIQGTEEEHLGAEIARISQGVASVTTPPVQYIPFAGKLMAPSAFYESYTQLHELARALMAPVIFAEDTDAIGTGALNPIAATIMSEEILATVSRRFAIKPFVTAVRLDYESWGFLARKHFGI